MLQAGEISKQLNDMTQKIKNKYDKSTIFGVFVVGDAACGLAEDISELRYICVLLPTIEELCFTEPQIYYEEDLGESVEVVDWRLLRNFGESQSEMMMQCLFTEFYWISPKYSGYFHEHIKPNAEAIYHADPMKRLFTVLGQAEEYADELILTQTYSGPMAMELARLELSIELYSYGRPCQDCVKFIRPRDIQYLLEIKHNKADIDVDEMINRIRLIVDNSTADNVQDEMGLSILHDIILGVVRLSLVKDVDEKLFLNKLTTKERQALKVILSSLTNGEGNVSIVKMIELAEVSRPVFIGLTQKMKESGIAEVRNMGAKGTYFRILSYNLLEMDIEEI